MAHQHSETDIRAAELCYGSPFNQPLHRMAHEAPSWAAHIILVEAFGFSSSDASAMINDLIRQSGGRFRPVFSEFTTEKRTWLLGCTYAPFVSGSLFNIYPRGEKWWQ